jgi:uncharacterized membrane protein YfcA
MIAYVLTALVGLALGLFGGGGSILALPVLVYVAGIAPQPAIAMSLAIVGATSLLAGALHRRGGRVDLRVAAIFGATGMVGSFLGSRLTHLVAEPVLMLAFAALMVVVGAAMLAGFSDRLEPRMRIGAARRSAWTALAGLVVGAATGFLGIGGGFLVVPALVLLARLPMAQAVGTSLFVIAANAAAGLAGHLADGPLDLGATAGFTLAAMVGAIAGLRLAGWVSPQRLRRGFALFVIAIGVLVAGQTLAAVG